jgi:flagellar hook-associated protein 3 FlgL
MRITSNMMATTILRNLNQNLERMAKTHEQMSSGVKVSRPSDDPIAVTLIMGMKSVSAEQEQHMKNMDDGVGWLDATDQAYGHAGEILKRANELAIQGANAPMSPTDKEAIAHEIKQMIDEMKQVGNTSYAGRYIFAGTRTEKPPFVSGSIDVNFDDKNSLTLDGTGVQGVKSGIKLKIVEGPNVAAGYDSTTNELTITLDNNTAANNTVANIQAKINALPPSGAIDFTKITVAGKGDFASGTGFTANTGLNKQDVIPLGDTIVYRGNQSNLDWEIAPKVFVGMNATGVDALNVNTKDNTSNLIGALEDLSNVLEGKGTKTFNDCIGDTQKQMDHVLNQRAIVGAKSNRLEMAHDRAEQVNTNLIGLTSKLEDTNVAEASINYSIQEAVYNAALMTGAKIIQPSILQFLK